MPTKKLQNYEKNPRRALVASSLEGIGRGRPATLPQVHPRDGITPSAAVLVSVEGGVRFALFSTPSPACAGLRLHPVTCQNRRYDPSSKSPSHASRIIKKSGCVLNNGLMPVQ